MAFIADSLDRIKPSPTISISNKVFELKAQGRDVIGLSAGEPDFDTPEHIKQAAIDAIRSGKTKYTHVDGIPELKAAIIAKMKRDHGLEYKNNQISVGTGRQAGAVQRADGDDQPRRRGRDPHAVLGLLHRHRAARRRRARVRRVPLENGYKLKPDDLDAGDHAEDEVADLQRAVQPHGRCLYEGRAQRRCDDVLMKHKHVWLLTDDMYEKLLYDGLEFFTPGTGRARPLRAHSDPQRPVEGVLHDGLAPRLRLRAGGADQGDVRSCRSQSTSNPEFDHSVCGRRRAQRPARLHRRAQQGFRGAARSRGVDAEPGARASSARRRRARSTSIRSCEGALGKTTPKGKKIVTDEDFVTALLEDEGVAVVHGSAFAMAPFFRISYATGTDVLTEACRRIQRFCNALD
jgi:aspartate aminotransferase